MIAKSSTNPVFLSARTGAEAAAKELSQKHGVPIEIQWLTPPAEDGQVQAQRIAQAVNEGAHAVLISCSDAGKVTGAINDAVARGVPVMTFDSDAPDSKRFAFYGVDDVKTGRAVMDELRKQMGEKGSFAILAGNQNAPNLRKRVDGVKEEAKKYPGMTVDRHLLSRRDAAGRRRRGDPRPERLSADPGLGDDRRLAALHAVAADRPRSEEGQDRLGRCPARRARLRREGAGAGPARAADLPVGLRLGAEDRRESAPEAGRPGDHPDGAGARVQGEPRNLGASAQGVGIHRRPRGLPEAASRERKAGERAMREADPSQAMRQPSRSTPSPSAFPAPSRSRTSASRWPPEAATRCAARTAPARARSARFWRAFIAPTPDACSSSARRPSSTAPSRRWPPASASSTRSWRSATT